MTRKVKQLFYFNEFEKKALVNLSQAKLVSQNEVIRSLLRDEAKRLALWPEVAREQQCTTCKKLMKDESDAHIDYYERKLV